MGVGRVERAEGNAPLRATSSPGRPMAPCVVDKYSAHCARGQREELDPVAPLDVSLLGEAQVCLVDKRRRRQRVTRVLRTQVAVSEPLELTVDIHKKLVDPTHRFAWRSRRDR